MEHLVDWNCRLLPSMRGLVADPEEAIATMRLLNERFCFTHFQVMPEYDATREPVSIFMLRYDRAIRNFLSYEARKDFHIRFQPCVMLSQGLYLTDGLKRLVTKRGNYLPIHMPISTYSDWIDFELNRLLYKKHVNLWFVSFEQCVLMYPAEIIDKLIHIKNAVFQFAFKSLTNPRVAKVIRKLAKANRVILLGTSVDCLERAYAFDYRYYEKTALDNLSSAVYQTILRQNSTFWTKQHTSY